jgi:hypothetical protein
LTATASPQRPIPTVQASPELLIAGDMVYPDISRYADTPYRVVHPAVSVRDEADRPGWRIELEQDCVLWVPAGKKVRTQRRPQPQPAPRARSEEEWEPDTVRRRVPERRPA